MSIHCGSENVMSRLTRTWASLPLLVILVIGATAAATASGGDGQTTPIHNLRLLPSSPMLTHQDMMTSSVFPLATVKSLQSSGGQGDPPKSRKVREITRVEPGGGVGGEDDISSAPASLGQDYSQSGRQSSKIKALYPQLSGSGELFRLFRPLALTPDKTIGLTRWYVPGFGYFNRGGRAASSNFIRFGRSGMGGGGYYAGEDDGGLNGGGDVSMLNRNNAKKKNNFIRLGRENPRQTNFIRLGRSGGGPSAVVPGSAGEFYNSAYITPALSDGFREDEDGRRVEMN